MKNTKLMAAIPMVATMVMPMTAFAATDYETTKSDVDYTGGTFTNDEKDTATHVTVTQGSTFSVRIPKEVVLDGTANGDNSAEYTVSVSGNIASDETINVVPDATFSMKDVKGVKADIKATVAQPVTKFVDSQVSVDGKDDTINLGDTTGKITVENLTSGSWDGSFNFNISLTSNSAVTE